MQNVLLLRHGTFRPLAVRAGTGWQPDDFEHPPVTFAGTYTWAGNVNIGITVIHMRGGTATKAAVSGELARALVHAQVLADSPDLDLDLMMVIGDANLQLIPEIRADGEVDVVLSEDDLSDPSSNLAASAQARAWIQCPVTHQRFLAGKGHVCPAGVDPALHWWPQVERNGPWIILRPSGPTLSTGKLADCAFVLRRRSVRMFGPWAAPWAWTWPLVKKGGKGAAHESFGSDGLSSDHRPIEVTFLFDRTLPTEP